MGLLIGKKGLDPWEFLDGKALMAPNMAMRRDLIVPHRLDMIKEILLQEAVEYLSPCSFFIWRGEISPFILLFLAWKGRSPSLLGWFKFEGGIKVDRVVAFGLLRVVWVNGRL